MTAKEIISILESNGWTLNRVKGFYYIFTKSGHRIEISTVVDA